MWFVELREVYPKAKAMERMITLPVSKKRELVLSLVDSYCDNPFCRCCRAVIRFMDEKEKVYATLMYGWESQSFYEEWGEEWEIAECLPRGWLYPWAPQSRYAEDLEEAFSVLARDSAFRELIKQRYALFRKWI